MVEVVVVDACLRHNHGGSPTAVVLDGDEFADTELMAIASRAGASHVAAVSCRDRERDPVVRFFTSTGPLPGCGHGTVAVIAVLTSRSQREQWSGRLQVSGRSVSVVGAVDSDASGSPVVSGWFDQGLVATRPASAEEQQAFAAALGLREAELSSHEGVMVASPGRERVLISVAERQVLARLRPDLAQLVEQSHRFGQLGCFVYVPPGQPSGSGGEFRVGAARMFAPAIGVGEDVANANSTGCLAAVLLLRGQDPNIAVDQGDALGRPSTVYASAEHTDPGITTRVGGTARVVSTERWP